MLNLISQKIFCHMKTEHLLEGSGQFTLSQWNPALISTFVSVCSDVSLLGENASLNSNQEFTSHPCQVWFRNKPRGNIFICVSSPEFRDSRDVQMAIHTAELMSLDRAVTNKYYIRV
jgi:hypothetical protein